MDITAKDIKKMVALLSKHKVKPKKIRSRKEADAANELDSIFGLKPHWRVGDEYYEANIHKDIIKMLKL